MRLVKVTKPLRLVRLARMGKRHDPVPPKRPTATGWVRYGEDHWVKIDAEGRPWIAWVP